MGKLRKIGKKIVKGIKTGLKSVGKAFKKAFKGIGKFIGKLGPIGMIGMMLIMPQLGAWWGQFGSWAGKLSGTFGKVMTGIHKAGSLVGQAYGTVTETIGKTLNVATGGTFSTAGTAGYQAGYSDQLANWMSSKMDVAREGLGLETTGSGVSTSTTTPDGTATTPTTTQDTTPNITDAPSAYTEDLTQAYSGADQQIIDQMKGFESQGLSTTADSLSSKLSTEGLNTYQTYGTEGYVDDFAGPTGKIVEAGPDLSNRIVQDITGKPSAFDRVKKIATTAYTTGSAIQDAATRLGLTAEEYEQQYGGGLGVVDGGVAMYEAANNSWTSQGFGGEAPYGIGNSNYFSSIYSPETLLPFGRLA